MWTLWVLSDVASVSIFLSTPGCNMIVSVYMLYVHYTNLTFLLVILLVTTRRTGNGSWSGGSSLQVWVVICLSINWHGKTESLCTVFYLDSWLSLRKVLFKILSTHWLYSIEYGSWLTFEKIIGNVIFEHTVLAASFIILVKHVSEHMDRHFIHW